MNLIRGDNPAAFTGKCTVSVNDLILQMLNRKTRTQFSEVTAYSFSMKKEMPVTEKAFFLAGKKCNPEAVRVMSNEYIERIYDDNMDKQNGLIILGTDGWLNHSQSKSGSASSR